MLSQKKGMKAQAIAYASYAFINTENQFILCEKVCGTNMDLRRLVIYQTVQFQLRQNTTHEVHCVRKSTK